MAMDPNALGVAVAAAIQSATPAPGTAITPSQLEAMWIAICTEIITEITTNGVTSTTVTGGSSAGTYTGTIS